MNPRILVLISLCSAALGAGAVYFAIRPNAVDKATAGTFDSPTFQEESPSKEHTLWFLRTVSLSTFSHGKNPRGRLQVEVKKQSTQPLPERDRIHVERAAQELVNLNRREKLLGSLVDRIDELVGVATSIEVSGVDAPKYARLTLKWDASKSDTDLFACVIADLNTGKITDVSFLSSDGRWSREDTLPK